MVQEIEPRFDPNGECTAVAVDFILNFLLNLTVDKNEIREQKSLLKIADFFTTKSLKVSMCLPLISFFSPLTIWAVAGHSKYFMNRRNFLALEKQVRSNQLKYCVLYRMTPRQLYGISGNLWVHYVVKYCDLDVEAIYDPLTLQYEVAMRKTREFDNIIAPRMIVWSGELLIG